MRCLNLIWVINVVASCCSAASLPNVLLITSEDNGPDLGCYGDRFADTPNIDRFAAEGARFERAFVPTASCSESRAALLTGLYPHQNGQIGLATHHYRMYGKLPNIASRLKQRGYRTGLIGKLHVNPSSAFPFDYRPNVSQCNTFARRDVRRVAELAADFMSADDGPFFLMVNYSDAHLPFLRQQHGLPPNPLSADEVEPLPWIGIDTPKLRTSQANYYNCLMRLDTGIGLLLTAVERAGIAGKTLVIYLGDHGAQFPRGKLASYESSLHVPLIIRQPERIKPQARGELVSSLDVLPTILEAVDGAAAKRTENLTAAALNRKLPGRSLWPLMDATSIAESGLDRDGQTPPDSLPDDWRTYLFTEYHGHNPPIFFPQRTVRDDQFKLILNLLQDRSNPVAKAYTGSDEPRHESYVTPADVDQASERTRRAFETWHDAPPVELYDLETDPHEWRNRADDPELADVKKNLLDQLKQWQDRTADPLRDRSLLRRLADEHDALPTPYQKPRVAHWRYPDYLAPADRSQGESLRLVQSRLIWDRAPHNAFTDLLRYNNRWYCVFREGTAHVSPDGALRVITSPDGKQWTSTALIESSTYDLRDAKITVTPRGQLMLNGAGMIADAKIRYYSMCWFSNDAGRTWTDGRQIGDPGFWLWRTHWYQGTAFSMGYSTERDRMVRKLRLYRSRDGREFETYVPHVSAPAGCGEDKILFLENGSALCLLRHETGDKMAQLGISSAPYTQWKWQDLNLRIGGPNMLELPDGRILAAVRLYEDGTRTSLAWLDPDRARLTEALRLPSGGDTSYAGMVWYENLLWISYYSSHEGKASIYLAKVEVP